MGSLEQEWLLAQLYALITVSTYQVLLRWQHNSLAMWDNQSTQQDVVGDYSP